MNNVVHCQRIAELSAEQVNRIQSFALSQDTPGTHASPAIVEGICRGFRQTGYWIEVCDGGKTKGVLPLIHMRSVFFGQFLVGLPYLNWGGVVSSDTEVAHLLVDRAVKLADQLDVNFLELRHEDLLNHPHLTEHQSEKCQMRMSVESEEQAWKTCRSTVRTQVRKGERHNFHIEFGRYDLLKGFYYVFSRNMRDLGTPVYSQELFSSLLDALGDSAELCVVRYQGEAIACAFSFHHENGLSEVPSASALREYRSTAVNTWMYWQLIKRAIEKGATTFDFGRSTPEGPTYDFKRKWGATPSPTCWQYYQRKGDVNAVRPSNSKYSRAIQAWQKLPLPVANLIGPSIVRGIP